MSFSQTPGLYVHLPFCVRRCHYCAFVSSVYDEARAERYLDALAREAQALSDNFIPATIYIGGGTPTALSLSQLDRLLAIVRPFSDVCGEWTVEANPGTVTVESFAHMKAAGVTRLSLGVQSFQEEGLRVLGRSHSSKQARGAVAMAREAGFDNLSLDLIFGWPGQTLALWEDDLAQALRLRVPHLSCYGLTYEAGTPLSTMVETGALTPVTEEVDRAMFDATARILGENGCPRYEISNFACPGCECLHNLNYWTGGEYVGLGAAAYSYRDGVRSGNTESVEEYIKNARAGESVRVSEECLEPERRARECAVIWLRLVCGIDATAFRVRTGFDLSELLARELPALLDGGWLAWDEDRYFLRLTSKAFPVADSVLAELVM